VAVPLMVHLMDYFGQRIAAWHVLTVLANFLFVPVDNHSFVLEASYPSRFRVSLQDIPSACVFAWISNQ